MFFQWVSCSAIWFVGVAVDIFFHPSRAHPAAMLGGAIWATGKVYVWVNKHVFNVWKFFEVTHISLRKYSRCASCEVYWPWTWNFALGIQWAVDRMGKLKVYFFEYVFCCLWQYDLHYRQMYCRGKLRLYCVFKVWLVWVASRWFVQTHTQLLWSWPLFAQVGEMFFCFICLMWCRVYGSSYMQNIWR